MAIEIVSFPMKNGGSFHSYGTVYQRVSGFSVDVFDDRPIFVHGQAPKKSGILLSDFALRWMLRSWDLSWVRPVVTKKHCIIINGNSRILNWRSYFLGIFPYIGLIYGRYLQFRILKWPLNDWEMFGIYLQFGISNFAAH